jgi:hypothetical protein
MFRPRSVDDVTEGSFIVDFELAFVPVQVFERVSKVELAAVGLSVLVMPGPLGVPIRGVPMMKEL